MAGGDGGGEAIPTPPRPDLIGFCGGGVEAAPDGGDLPGEGENGDAPRGKGQGGAEGGGHAAPRIARPITSAMIGATALPTWRYCASFGP